MAVAPNTNSTLTFPNGTNRTSVSLSTNIIMLVNNTAVGAVQELSINETRPIKMIDEVGTDGHVDSCPTASTNITGSCQRIRYDRLTVTQAFSRGFLHASAQVYPFDLVILDKQTSDKATQISTIIKNIWIMKLSHAYRASDWLITDTMDWEAEFIYSIMNNGPVAQGGVEGNRAIKYSAAPGMQIEQTVDSGANGYRGSMTASGLIDLGSTGNIF